MNATQFLSILFSGGSLAVMLFLSACDNEGIKKPPIGPANAKLPFAWQCESVTVDDVDRTSVYADFRITFAATTYTTINGSPIFAPSGTWIFADESGGLLVVDGSLQVAIKFVGDDRLELSLQWDKFSFEAGRTTSVKGRHVFKLRRVV